MAKALPLDAGKSMLTVPSEYAEMQHRCHRIVLVVALCLGACGASSAAFDEAARNVWASTPSRCDQDFVTFGEGEMRFHREGKIFSRLIIGDAKDDATQTNQFVLKLIPLAEDVKKLEKPDGNNEVLIGYRLDQDRLLVVKGGIEGAVADIDPKNSPFSTYNFVKCRTI